MEKPIFKIVINSIFAGNQNNMQDVVKKINYTVVAEKAGEYVISTDVIDLMPPDPEHFTPFESLTEQQVIGWLEQQERIISTKIYLEDILEKKIQERTITVKIPPWVPVPPTLPPPPNLLV